jgi:hypothetical protein
MSTKDIEVIVISDDEDEIMISSLEEGEIFEDPNIEEEEPDNPRAPPDDNRRENDPLFHHPAKWA